MKNKIVYLGDTHLKDAACYLSGLMTAWNWEFEYLPSDQPVTSELLIPARALYILSDYPAEQFSEELQTQLIEKVQQGSGVLMLGGWESYHGLGGNWHSSHLSKILPVQIAQKDDRLNSDQLLLVAPTSSHEITKNLPWNERPPIIGGMNLFQAKPNAEVLLNAHRFEITLSKGNFSFEEKTSYPLLVVDTFEEGRVAAFATDVAPHWVGPLVDWGNARVTAQAANANQIEVGSDYAQFFKQLLSWVGRIDQN